MGQKYNPDIHSAVVRNYRDAFREIYQKECPLTDARIWDITGEWVGLEGGVKAEEQAILEQMFEESEG